jgi:hypothetical protein
MWTYGSRTYLIHKWRELCTCLSLGLSLIYVGFRQWQSIFHSQTLRVTSLSLRWTESESESGPYSIDVALHDVVRLRLHDDCSHAIIVWCDSTLVTLRSQSFYSNVQSLKENMSPSWHPVYATFIQRSCICVCMCAWDGARLPGCGEIF